YLYEQYQSHLQQIAEVRYATAVLQWDQETYMPPKGAAFRARQTATLSEWAHRLFTEHSFRDLLQELGSRNDLDDAQKKNVELSWYDYSQQEKLSASFVRTMSELVSRSYQSWMAARRQNDFGIFAPDLAKLADLKKQEADLLGYEGHPYNALLNQYERGATTTLLDRVFSQLQEPLRELLGQIAAAPQVKDDFLHQSFAKDPQWKFGMEVLREMGFDFEAGRQDISEHPFTTNFSSRDVRVTTRIHENDFTSMTWSCIHEGGHALYEQGLPEEAYGLPLGEFTSLSIHESQSRLWENNVGRGLDAWRHFYPLAQQYFPEQLGNVPLEDFYRAINKVQPSLIRTEADELTYHFHVLTRYELEKQLMEGALTVNDIPGWWNERYKTLLDVTVPDDLRGCLQDVHWSHGSFGYFPTYSLGSFYAAQFFHAATEQVPGLADQIRKGGFQPLLNWLRINIHSHGRRWNSEELCLRVTGQTLDIGYFMKYAREKYKTIYRF
ncbi:MAG: carboxypeptidase M32, partial [Bacteroidetes bacterium]|nr:carboxypeptidase M32 [Bacteroidota bacterium]